MKALGYLASLCAVCALWSVFAYPVDRPEQFNSLDITGAQCCRDLRLADESGRLRTLSDFRGKVVVIAFGYTYCSTVCPTTLADLARARRSLGSLARDVQVLFVTLDPARDSGAVLRAYLNGFDRSFIPLRGSEEQVARTASDFRIVFDRDTPGADGGYDVYHTSGAYVFDRSGRPRLFASVTTANLLAADLRTLLR